MIKSGITLYTLRHKGTKFYADYFTQVNHESIHQVQITHYLNFVPNPTRLWLVDSKEKAELAKIPTIWYDAKYETPSHNQYTQDLEVIEIALP
jgi:hypothetical protein